MLADQTGEKSFVNPDLQIVPRIERGGLILMLGLKFRPKNETVFKKYPMNPDVELSEIVEDIKNGNLIMLSSKNLIVPAEIALRILQGETFYETELFDYISLEAAYARVEKIMSAIKEALRKRKADIELIIIEAKMLLENNGMKDISEIEVERIYITMQENA